MYAIVEIAGQQFKVEKDQQVFVHRLEGKEGSKVEFDRVLLIDNKGKITVGVPAVDGAMVSAKIVEHLKSDKTIVFKKKRRKGYKKKNGHRQYLTKIEIEKIAESGARKKASSKKETKAGDEKSTSAAEKKKSASTKAKKKSTSAKSKSKKTTEKKKTTTKKKSTKSSSSSTAKKKSTSTAGKKSGGSKSKKENKSDDKK